MNVNFNYSPNFDTKKRKIKEIKFIIFHYTGMKKEIDAINRLTNREIVEKDLYFWKTLPRSPKKAEGISDFYFTNRKCKKGHLSPRRTVNRNCLSCEISEESLNKNRKYKNGSRYF